MFPDIDYSRPIHEGYFTGIMTEKKSAMKVNFWVFVDIFSKITWLCIAISVLVLALAFLYVQTIFRQDKTTKLDLFDAICLVYFIIIQLGWEFQVRYRYFPYKSKVVKRGH